MINDASKKDEKFSSDSRPISSSMKTQDSERDSLERRKDGREASVIILNLASSVNTGDNL